MAVARPSATSATTAFRPPSEPARPVLFLGSSTTAGIWAKLRRQAGSSTGSSPGCRRRSRRTTSPPRPATSANTPIDWDEKPGVQGINGALGGATAATYFTDADEYAVHVLQPACVVHMIGSNDSVVRSPAADLRRAGRGRLYAARLRPAPVLPATSCCSPCVATRSASRSGRSTATPSSTRRAAAARDLRRPRQHLRGARRARRGSRRTDRPGRGAPHRRGPRPAGRDAGRRARPDATWSRHGHRPATPDTDRDGIGDGREVRGYVVHQRVVTCSGAVRQRLRTTSVPYLEDTDHDAVSDRREVHGYRLGDGRLVRSDPSDPDTDRDGRADGREAARGGADPTTGEGRRPTG